MLVNHRSTFEEIPNSIPGGKLRSYSSMLSPLAKYFPEKQPAEVLQPKVAQVSIGFQSTMNPQR